jgi:hypothetical protein
MHKKEGSQPRGRRGRCAVLRSARFTVRFSAVELDQLRRAQREAGSATLSAYLRIAGLGKPLPPHKEIPSANLEAYRRLGEVALDLRQLGTNLNTIAVRLLTVAGGERPLAQSLAARLPVLQAAVAEARAELKVLRQELVGAG